jgi:hypothetical protein
MSDNITLDFSKYAGTYSVSEAENIISKMEIEIEEAKNNTKKINELSREVSLKGEDAYAQLTMQLLDKAETRFIVKDSDHESYWEISYDASLVLELIDKNRKDDIYVLNKLVEILNEKETELKKKYGIGEDY